LTVKSLQRNSELNLLTTFKPKKKKNNKKKRRRRDLRLILAARITKLYIGKYSYILEAAIYMAVIVIIIL
tara:strand:- start:1052 stop:1261 length:210 start_codon:yes stop_codon:yes gene_type:complete